MPQRLLDVRNVQRLVKARAGSRLHHARRQVDSNDMGRHVLERGRHQPCAAAKIDHAREGERLGWSSAMLAKLAAEMKADGDNDPLTAAKILPAEWKAPTKLPKPGQKGF